MYYNRSNRRDDRTALPVDRQDGILRATHLLSMSDSLKIVRHELWSYADTQKASFFPRFFKTKQGEYGYGDQFIGVTVPQVRKVALKCSTLSEKDVIDLLQSPIHEERLLSLLILVTRFQKGNDEIKKHIASLYLKHIKWVNNWDLVDSSADKILGAYSKDHGTDILFTFARSKDLWRRRIAIVATYHYIKQGDATLALEIATILKDDTHDLIQKAVGWMLREVGKRCGKEKEELFLNLYAATMPRTMLRYSLEHFSPEKREYYMNLGKKRI